MDKAAIYCRLSREDADKIKKGDDSESIQNQKLLLMDYATEHDMQIYKIYSDDDYSGADKERPGWNRMLKDAENGDFNVIICKTQSRFTRELEMVEKLIHGSFLEWGIRFIGVVDHVDTNMKGNKKSRQINGLVNEWYLEDLSENIKAVFRRKMEDGQFLGAFAPYGYRKDPSNRHRIVIDEESAKVVKQIYDLYTEGYSIKRICSILTESQIPTPTAYKQSMGYTYKNPNSNSASSRLGVWGSTTVRNILTNNTYIGVLTQGKEKKLSYKSKKVVRAPESDWVVLEDNHEAIIDKNIFDQVQKILKSNRTVSSDIKGNIKLRAHCLAGKVKCPDCGSSMVKTGGGSSRESRYLRCQLASKTGNKKCTPHAIRLNQLIDTVASEIRLRILAVMNVDNEKYLSEGLCSSISNRNSAIETKSKDLNRIGRMIQDNKEALSALYMDKVKKLITEDEFSMLKETFYHEINQQKEKYAKLKGEIEYLTITQFDKTDALTLAKRYTDFEELTGEIVMEFIDYIVVGEKDMFGNQELHIYWNI